MSSSGAVRGGATFTQGTIAARPAAAPNILYFATDTGEWWVSNAAGTVWQEITRVGNGFVLDGFSNTQANGQSGGWNLNGNLDINSAGSGLQVKEGSNAKQGTAVLVAGTVVVSNTSVTATSRILLTGNVLGGTAGAANVSARTAGTSFTITSTNAADTSTVAFQMFEPG